MRALTFAAAAIAVSATIAVAPAMAFNCNPISNFGPNLTPVANGATCNGGGTGTVTLHGPGETGFTVHVQGTSWDGIFPNGDFVLYDAGPGSVTIDFTNTITSTTDLTLETDQFGSYTATLTALLNGAVVGSDSFTAVSSPGPAGTIPSFNFTDLGGYNEIVLSSTNDSTGFAFGFVTSSVPEPAAWAMMLTGFLGLGAVLRSRRKLATASV